MSPVPEAAPGARRRGTHAAACPHPGWHRSVASRLVLLHPLRKNHPALNPRPRWCLGARMSLDRPAMAGLRSIGGPESGLVTCPRRRLIPGVGRDEAAARSRCRQGQGRPLAPGRGAPSLTTTSRSAKVVHKVIRKIVNENS